MTHNDVPASDKLQAHLEHGDVQEVDEVTQVIHQQPEVDVVQRLIGEGPAHGNQPAVPVPGQHHEEQPQDVHQVCRGRGGKVLEPQPEKGPSSRCVIGMGLSYFHLSIWTFLPALNVALLEGKSKC